MAVASPRSTDERHGSAAEPPGPGEDEAAAPFQVLDGYALPLATSALAIVLVPICWCLYRAHPARRGAGA